MPGSKPQGGGEWLDAESQTSRNGGMSSIAGNATTFERYTTRDGDYCIPCIERMDSRRPSPIHADEKERVLRCECFTPIPEDEEEKK